MSPRSTGVDEEGRPIVAELGRAETPGETAERKAAASATRRSGQTALNLFIAVLASLGVVAFVVVVVVRPDQYVAAVLPLTATAELAAFFDGCLATPHATVGSAT